MLPCASPGRPAVYKLRKLAKVEDVLSNKRLHNELLDAGVLGGKCRGPLGVCSTRDCMQRPPRVGASAPWAARFAHWCALAS